MRDVENSKAFVLHLRAEHRQIADLLRGIQKLFQSGQMQSENGSEHSLIDGLTALRNELDRHFHEEEQGGCIEEAVCRCPSLSQEATRVEQEHPVLLERLDSIIGRAKAAPSVIADIEHEVAIFSSQLLAHEAAENRILQRAFGSNCD